jgi:ring-1,2-phenylacetyl-CoA epoxidase subunit PaaD
MQLNARECLIAHGVQEPIVEINHQKLWSSNNITERGRKHLLDFGLSPPPKYIQEVTEEVLEAALCPKCGSQNTQLKNPFGPTLCRAIHYCNNCFETFEQFKPL